MPVFPGRLMPVFPTAFLAGSRGRVSGSPESSAHLKLLTQLPACDFCGIDLYDEPVCMFVCNSQARGRGLSINCFQTTDEIITQTKLTELCHRPSWQHAGKLGFLICGIKLELSGNLPTVFIFGKYFLLYPDILTLFSWYNNDESQPRSCHYTPQPLNKWPNYNFGTPNG